MKTTEKDNLITLILMIISVGILIFVLLFNFGLQVKF